MADQVFSLFLSHSNLTMGGEVRFHSSTTVASMKDKLYLTTGTPAEYQRLVLKDGSVDVAALDDDSATLGEFMPQSGWTLHVIDVNPSSVSAGGALEDTSKVEKFKISRDAYEKRDDTFLKFKARMAGGGAGTAAAPEADENAFAEEAKALEVGNRCEVMPGGRRGYVRFVGKIASGKPGFWVGVELDEPAGKNDGSSKGVAYFSCAPNHGVFVRPTAVHQGDYPPLAVADDDSEL